VAAKKVTFAVGMVSIATRIEVAADEESSDLHTVCTDGGAHDPVRCKQYMECPVCATQHSSHWGFPEKGVERDGKMVVLTQDEIAAATGAPVTGRAGEMPVEISFHPREKVYAATVAADSVQNVYPDKGSEKAYVALRETLRTNPGIVAVMIWAPAKKNALWVLEVAGEHLVATKMCWPEQVRPTVEVPMAEVSDAELSMFQQLIESTVEDFDLGRYVNQSKLDKEALVASRAGTAIGTVLEPGVAARSSVPDLMAALEASMAKAGAKPRKAPAKKAAAKKTAKKAAPRKRAAAKKTAAA
jgi:DNA end-binding protein Ku